MQFSIGDILRVSDIHHGDIHGFMPDEVVEVTDLRTAGSVVALVCASNEREYTGILMGTEVEHL